jgi:hypothetical protein
LPLSSRQLESAKPVAILLSRLAAVGKTTIAKAILRILEYSPPWNRQRRFPGTTLMMHGAPARVLAQHLGRNLRFKGSPVRDRPRSSIL